MKEALRLTKKNFFSLNKKWSKIDFFKHYTTSLHPKIPTLPLLNEMVERLETQNYSNLLENTAIVGIQHILPSTASLFDCLIDGLGAKPSNMYFNGKFYSTCRESENYIQNRGVYLKTPPSPKRPGQYQENAIEAAKQMWDIVEETLNKNNTIERVIILSDGGICLETVPKSMVYNYKIAGVEQTRFGLYNQTADSQLFPLVDVARSATKRNLESPLIADAVLKRVSKVLKEISINKNTVFGVIGNGAVGSAVTKFLLSNGYNVVIYDESNSAFHGIKHKKCYRFESVGKVISGSDIVFGCTGKDITKNIDVLQFVKQQCTFISCSSQDIEFLSLLKKINREGFIHHVNNNVSQLKYLSENNQEITVLENGFPINFDRTAECDPVNDMELTRALLLQGVIQAAFMAQKPIDDGVTINRNSSFHQLDPFSQRFIVSRWKENQPAGRYTKEEFECFNDINWIIKNSGGAFQHNDDLKAAFERINFNAPSPKLAG